jgi:hypothetical protein
VVGAGDLLDVGVGQFAMDSIDQRAELPRVDEQRLLAAVAAALVSQELTRGRSTTILSADRTFVARCTGNERRLVDR